MKAFKGLMTKDFHISKGWFFINIIGQTILLLVAYSLGLYFDNVLDFVIQILMLFIVFNILFAPVILLQMLHLEGKTQLWLHNPQSSRNLLLSKLILSISFQLISQLFLTSIGLLVYTLNNDGLYVECKP